jgi:F0F1-type ATP synthase gamma subunit
MQYDAREVTVTQSPDNQVRDVLHRQSARSMGYRKVYVAPLQEEDPTPEAKRRRILRVAGPAAIAAAITFALVASLIFGVGKWMQAMVAAERNINEIVKQQELEKAEQARRAPITVTIDANAPAEAPASPPPK